MKQRVPGRAWYSPGLDGRRPRMLVESDSEALAISDFSLFQQAGFDVAFCSGPGRTPTRNGRVNMASSAARARRSASAAGSGPRSSLARGVVQWARTASMARARRSSS